MNETDAAFVDKLMRTYYYGKFRMIEPPTDIVRREFGFVRAGGTMVRHQAAKDANGLRLMLMREHPLEVFASNARYLFPERWPMDDKGWLDADLIFDVDAKDLEPECGRRHVLYACGTCCRPANGGCGCGSATRKASMPCGACIGAAKAETRRLIDVLERDFGITGPAIHFSGNEGFHVYVKGGWPADLGRRERADMAGYLMAAGLRPETVGITADTNNPPSADDGGMRGRFAAAAGPAWSMAGAREMAGNPASFRAAARRAAVRIDPSVTFDIGRVFRLAGSLNGKSGLAKVAVGDLDAFAPYEEAVVLPDDPVTVTAYCPKFVLGGRDIGPCNGEAAVPAYAAVWLICRGLAHCR